MKVATTEAEIAADVTEEHDVCDKSDEDNDCKIIKTDDASDNNEGVCLQEDKENDTKSNHETEGGIKTDEAASEMITPVIENSNDSQDTSLNVSHEEKVTTSDDVEVKEELYNPDVVNVTEDPTECREITQPQHIEKDGNPPQQANIELPTTNPMQSLSFNADEDSSGIVRISDEDLKDVNGKSSSDSKKGGSEGSASDDWETEFDLELENVEVINSVEVTEGVDVSKAFSNTIES